YRRHARNTQAPVLDLELLQIKTFRIGTLTGGICRVGLDATPFLLPLFFQIGFGLSPVRAGLLSFSSTLGAMFVRSFSGAALRVIVPVSDEVTTGDFRIVLVLIALIPLCSAAGFLRLTEADGAEVSGHRTGAAAQPAAR